MKVVMPSVRPEILAWRKRTGADRWDEMWEGVLHMPPMPNSGQQDLEWALETFLRTRWARRLGAKVFHQINVASPGGWPDDWRIPDLVLLRAYFGRRSVGPRPSEGPPGKARRRRRYDGDIAEAAQRSMAGSQPAEARMVYRNRL